MSKVSVIVPLYNVEDYLRTTVETAMRQTYTDLEIILVDDGSTDGSGALCDALAAGDERIRVIHKPNGGVAEARNAGLDAAEGEYIFFLDSDDIIPDDAIEVLVNMCMKNEAELAMAAYVRFRDVPVKVREREYSTECFDDREAVRRMLGNMGYTHGLWNKLYQADLWDGIRFRVGKLYEDLDTSFKVVSRVSRAVYTDRPLYQYRVHTGSIMHSNIKESNIELLDICDKVTDDVVAAYPDLEEYARDLKARTYMKLMKNILDTGFDVQIAAQQRIMDYIKSEKKNLLGSSVVKSVDKIKVRTLCMGRRVFYTAYRFGDIKNHRL